MGQSHADTPGSLPGDPHVGPGSSPPTNLGESGIATPHSTRAAAPAPSDANGAGMPGSTPAIATRLTGSEAASGMARREPRGGPSDRAGAAVSDPADAAQPWAGPAGASPQADARPAAAATAASSGRATFISPAQVPARVAQLAAALGEPGARSVRLRLDPPSLGEIRVHIESSSQGITVRIVAQSHEACASSRIITRSWAASCGARGYLSTRFPRPLPVRAAGASQQTASQRSLARELPGRRRRIPSRYLRRALVRWRRADRHEGWTPGFETDVLASRQISRGDLCQDRRNSKCQ